MHFRLSIEKLIMYFISILLLMGSSCMFFLILPAGSIEGITNIPYIFLTFFCLIGCFYHGKMRINLKSIMVLSFLVLYLLFYLVITRSNPVGYLTKHVLIFIIFFFYCGMLINKGQFGEFVKIFVNVISAIALLSLFFWLFGSILGVIKGVSTSYIWAGNYKTVNYFWLYFENVIQATEIFGRTVVRNTGIYAEAPGFSGYLIIALAIVIPSEKGKFSRKQKILLIITMLTTLSTKGLIGVLILITLSYLFTYPAKSTSKFIKKCFFAIIILVVASIGIISLLEDKSTTGSFIVRMDDVQAAVSAWKNHVLFGSGYQQTEEIIQYFQVIRGNNGLSMGITLLLAQGGIYMFIFYIIPFFLGLYTSIHIDRMLFMRIMIFGIMVAFNLLISSFHYDTTTIFIIACGYAFSCTVTLKTQYQVRNYYRLISMRNLCHGTKESYFVG